jgi:polysaccharide deacetylase 2 family uncharacterized protein YibQ
MGRAFLIRDRRRRRVMRRLSLCAGLAALALVAPSFSSMSDRSGNARSAGAAEAADALTGLPAAEEALYPDGLRASRPISAATLVAPGRGEARSLPAIAICIDDMGGNSQGTAMAMTLPPDVTLAFLPYASTTPLLAQQSKDMGHEILAHVPMEPIGSSDPGPKALKVGASDNAERLAWALSRVPGLSGINNHEGSKFSSDYASLLPVVQILAERRLFFFDSRTIAASQIVRASHRNGVESAGRDVFLDNVLSERAVRARLDELVTKAKKSGVAIAIGHPHGVTMRVLADWLAQDHGVRLVPVSEAIRLKSERSAIIAAR